jgi:hypothetical protein
MQSFDVAHIRERGVDLIVVFVDQKVGRMTDEERNGILLRLSLCARSAGLAGFVVLSWPEGFFCNRRFHGFFQSTPYRALVAQRNRTLRCDNI